MPTFICFAHPKYNLCLFPRNIFQIPTCPFEDRVRFGYSWTIFAQHLTMIVQYLSIFVWALLCYVSFVNQAGITSLINKYQIKCNPAIAMKSHKGCKNRWGLVGGLTACSRGRGGKREGKQKKVHVFICTHA